MRTRYRRLDAQEVQLGGIEGNELTLAEEESLEKNGYLFARAGGKMPARQLNGVQLRKRMADYAGDLAAVDGASFTRRVGSSPCRTFLCIRSSRSRRDWPS